MTFNQSELWYITIKAVYPNPLPGAVSAEIGVATNGHEYILKSGESNPLIPATEWFCSGLAKLCQIAVPHYDVVLVLRAFLTQRPHFRFRKAR